MMYEIDYYMSDIETGHIMRMRCIQEAATESELLQDIKDKCKSDGYIYIKGTVKQCNV